VVKIGSSLLASNPAERAAAVADELGGKNTEAVIVSSGAIALGARALGGSFSGGQLPQQQAAAAVGQTELMRNWENAFSTHARRTAQVLLTHDDMDDRGRFLNARHTLKALLAANVVPIINENDTVAVEEIRYGDNDLLAALVANLIEADALIILTDVDGLLDGHPSTGGSRIPIIRDVDREAAPVAKGASRWGSGGMASKILAAKSAARHGIPTLVALGSAPGILQSCLKGADVGTLFIPSGARMTSRKHWLAYAAKVRGAVTVDAGAFEAVKTRGKSLLSIGIIEVSGEFGRGDLVSLVTADRGEFARGLVSYNAGELKRLIGVSVADIESTLGYKYLDEAIHRDDLALL